MHENAGGEGVRGQLTRFPELYKGCQDSSLNVSSSICLGGRWSKLQGHQKDRVAGFLSNLAEPQLRIHKRVSRSTYVFPTATRL